MQQKYTRVHAKIRKSVVSFPKYTQVHAKYTSRGMKPQPERQLSTTEICSKSARSLDPAWTSRVIHVYFVCMSRLARLYFVRSVYFACTLHGARPVGVYFACTSRVLRAYFACTPRVLCVFYACTSRVLRVYLAFTLRVLCVGRVYFVCTSRGLRVYFAWDACTLRVV